MKVKDKYIGIPLINYNCWEFICLYYENELGIKLKNFKGWLANTEKKLELSRFLNEYFDSDAWERVDIPNRNDIVMFNIKGVILHGGIVLGKNHMLHMQVIGSSIEPYNSKRWDYRIHGFYRSVFQIAKGDL